MRKPQVILTKDWQKRYMAALVRKRKAAAAVDAALRKSVVAEAHAQNKKIELEAAVALVDALTEEMRAPYIQYAYLNRSKPSG